MPGSANPRYLEHGWKRVIGWRWNHDKGDMNQTRRLKIFLLGMASKSICGNFLGTSAQGRQVYTPPSRGLTRSFGAAGDVLDPKGGVSVSPTDVC